MDSTGQIGGNVRKKTKGIGLGVKVRKKTKGIGVKVRKKTKEKPFLPDDIIPNILRMLPAKNASKCRLVCKGWRDLTLTQDFVDLHFRHSIPMIMVANRGRNSLKSDHFLLDKWWETARRKLMIHTFPSDREMFHSEYESLFSHAGLVVYRKLFIRDFIFHIHNPINLEKVTIFLSGELGRGSEIYGVFFHPSLREYCSLWGIVVWRTTWDQPVLTIQYKLLNLGSIPTMKTICNPFTSRYMRCDSYPLFIDKYLYWMLEPQGKCGYHYGGHSDIMQFDIINEELRVKPCPVPVDTECDRYHTHLLNIDGALSFIAIFPSKITIWRLEDHAEQSWTTTNYTFSSDNIDCSPKPIAVVDGNLALLSDRRFFVYNLMQGTTKCFRKTKYNESVLFLSHQMSLASLRNCQSTIYIDEKGEVDVMENSLTSGSSDGLAGSPDSNILVNEGSDPHVEESMSFEIASTDDDDEEEEKDSS